jgi:hypothetical protein
VILGVVVAVMVTRVEQGVSESAVSELGVLRTGLRLQHSGRRFAARLVCDAMMPLTSIASE